MEGLVTGVTIATPVKRLFALIMEYITAFFFLWLIVAIMGGAGGTGSDGAAGFAALVVLGLSVGLIVWSFVLFAKGQTPGKYFLGLRVLDVNRGQAASFGMMFLREVVAKPVIMVLSSITLGIVNFWLVWDRDSQELWDKVVNTVVVHDPERRTIRSE